VVGLGVAVDQAAKWQVFNLLSRTDSGRMPLVAGVLSLTARRHEGAAFGFFEGHNYLLLAFSAAAMVVVTVMAAWAKDNRQGLGVGLIGGGALGNLVDRLFLGHVRDFIDFPVWPTFNVADSLITIGVIYLAWQVVADRLRQKKSTQ